MSKHLVLVTEFNTCGGREVKKFTERTVPSVETRDSSISLIFEELSEYAKASGRNTKFAEFCRKYYFDSLVKTENGFELPPNTDKFDEAEVLDALNDLEVTVLGGYNVCGYTDIADESFQDVMESNMSKFLDNKEDAIEACKENSELMFVEISLENRIVYALRRISDNKIMKGKNYKKVDHKEKYFSK